MLKKYGLMTGKKSNIKLLKADALDINTQYLGLVDDNISKKLE